MCCNFAVGKPAFGQRVLNSLGDVFLASICLVAAVIGFGDQEHPGASRGEDTIRNLKHAKRCGEVMRMGAERDEGSNWHTLQRFIAGYINRHQTCASQDGTYAPSPRRLATKSSGSGKKSPPGKAGARRTQKGPGIGAGPQGRRDPRHRTDPLGRSARFAARSLTCFKFRIVSSPRSKPVPTNSPPLSSCSR